MPENDSARGEKALDLSQQQQSLQREQTDFLLATSLQMKDFQEAGMPMQPFTQPTAFSTMDIDESDVSCSACFIAMC